MLGTGWVAMSGLNTWLRITAAACALAACLLAPCARAADEPAGTRELVVLADFDIGADGHVTDIALQSPDVPPAIGELVANAARKWTFEPVLVDGVASQVRTRAAIRLRAVPVEAGYLLGIQGIGFGSRMRAAKMVPPQYPRDAMRHGIDASVQLYVERGSDGKVTDARIISTAIGGARGARELASRAAQFEQAAKQAAMQWRFDVTPEVQGGSEGSTALWIPINFVASGHPLVPVPGRGEVSQDVLDRVTGMPRAGSGPIALASRVRLRQDVVGTTL